MCGVGPLSSGCIDSGCIDMCVFAFRRLICASEDVFDMCIGGDV